MKIFWSASIGQLDNVPTSTGRSERFQSGVLLRHVVDSLRVYFDQKDYTQHEPKIYAAASVEVTTTV